MSKKSKIENRATERLIQLKKELADISMVAEDNLTKIEQIYSNIILLQELLTAPDDKELI